MKPLEDQIREILLEFQSIASKEIMLGSSDLERPTQVLLALVSKAEREARIDEIEDALLCGEGKSAHICTNLHEHARRRLNILNGKES